MNSHILTNARIVTPNENFTGTVEIENGLIADIIKGKVYNHGRDMNGQWLIPGCIDIHTDYLEKELHPRPTANFPLPFALHFLDARAAGCGITTVFSAVSFSDDAEKNRGFEEAIELVRQVDKIRDTLLVRHFLHARIDPNTNAIFDFLAEMSELESLYLLVYNENVPGQRQFRMDDLIEKKAKSERISMEEARELLLRKVNETICVNTRGAIQAQFGERYIIGSHDDTTIEHVIEAKAFGATLSEMPTTIEAARKAKELGMWVCMGAPNYYRGGSHCGNLSCEDAMKEDLVDILCSDYHFPTMLSSITRMIEQGMDPSKAVNLVSLNPARLLKMDGEIGSVEIGKKADLVTFDIHNSFARVSNVFVDGRIKYFTEYSHKTSPAFANAE